ncbi:MAG TPA: M48 family metalloprotease [Alphaproteobacteria bacterium]
MHLPRSRAILFGLMTLTALSLSLGGCSTNPATGQSIFTGLMSPEQEQAMGDEQSGEITAEYGGVNDNAKLNEFVAMIGAKLVPYTERRDVPNYTFTVLNSDDVNAFAMPGGYIYITRGLLSLAENEAQVAGVLAHELGHIQGRHSAQQYSQTALANIGVGLLGAAIGGTGGEMAGQAVGLGAQAGLMKYSRTHEFEADSLGIRYMQLAGYDPKEAARFLETLDRSTQFENKINGTGQGANAFSFLSSHPATPDRVQRAYTLASQTPQNINYYLGRDKYMSAIDGTNYGGSSKSGFVRGNEYIHPQMGFRFSVPAGFNIQNGEKQVAAENGRGALIVFDMGKGLTNDPVAYLSQSWLQNLAPANVEPITVNGLSAATGIAVINSSAGTKDGRFIAISAERGEFYRLAYLTPQGQQSSYTTDFQRSTYSFAKLTQAEKEKLSPNNIRIVTVGNGDTPATLAKKMAVPDHALDRFCLLNGVTPETTLKPGDKIKLVQPF